MEYQAILSIFPGQNGFFSKAFPIGSHNYSSKIHKVVFDWEELLKSPESSCSEVYGHANHNGDDWKSVCPTVCKIKFASCLKMGFLQKTPHFGLLPNTPLLLLPSVLPR